MVTTDNSSSNCYQLFFVNIFRVPNIFTDFWSQQYINSFEIILYLITGFKRYDQNDSYVSKSTDLI